MIIDKHINKGTLKGSTVYGAFIYMFIDKMNFAIRALLSLLLFFISSRALASFEDEISTVTAAVVSGSVQVNENTASGVDSSKPENIVIFGGYVYNATAGNIGGCPGTTNSSVCDSCHGTNTITNLCTGNRYACAERSIYPDLRLAITMTLDTLPSATPAIRAELASSSTTTTTSSIAVESDSTPPTAAGQSFTVYIKWSSICQKLGLDDCTKTQAAEGEINVGLADSSAGTLASGNYQRFTIKIRGVDPTSNNLVTPPSGGTSTRGVYNFQMLPGDEKAYIRDIKRVSNSPDSSVSIKWKSLRVYYSEYVGTPDFCAIDPSVAGSAELEFSDRNATGDTSIGKEYLDGLTNEKDYMFLGASVDEASIVTEFLNISAATSAVQNQFLATPGEVVGLLDKHKCFVATAAFGSPMNEHVNNLRKFRDQFLVKQDWGKNFVRFYYRNSTKWAHYIDEHEVLKPIVRFFLWPLVAFVELSFQIGIISTLLIFALVFFAGLVLLSKKIKGKSA